MILLGQWEEGAGVRTWREKRVQAGLLSLRHPLGCLRVDWLVSCDESIMTAGSHSGKRTLYRVTEH